MFVALIDADGKELSYYGYSRQRFNPDSGDEWDCYTFQPVPNDVKLSKAAICVTETSPWQEFTDFEIQQHIEQGCCPTFYLKGKFSPDV